MGDLFSEHIVPVPGPLQRNRGQFGELRAGPELAADGQQGPPPPGAQRGEPFHQHAGRGGRLQCAPLRFAGKLPNCPPKTTVNAFHLRPVTS